MEKKMKWMRHLPSHMIRTALHFDPEMVVRVVHFAPKYTEVRLYCTDGKYAQGISICSTLDEWDYKTGKCLAFSRAITALLTEERTGRIRKTVTRKWKPAQDRRVRNVVYRFKSFFRECNLRGYTT
ncbi:hypothetical protein LCGC14_1529260 [marine sediment metagenome]|uniref:Uncharacterized protein n=1 Tax=marine sediment metagenome TaxID=412755 RepID=A0A0F9LX91_9ZZZZ